MAGLDVLPWHLSLTPARLDDRYVHRLVPWARGKCLPHAAGPHEANEVTFVQHISMLTSGGSHPQRWSKCSNHRCGPSLARPGSREQDPAGRESRRRAVATVLFAQAHRWRAAGIKGTDSDLAHTLSHRRLLGILCIYRYPMYVSWEGAG
jgi:hypothetical protein